MKSQLSAIVSRPRSVLSTGAVAPGIPTRQRSRRVAAVGAAICSWEAGGVHLLEARSHAAWWWAAGVFFVAIGLVQVVSAVAVVWRRRAWLLHSMVWANAIGVAVYVVSRTNGIPGAPGIPLHGAKLRPGVPLLPGGIEPVRPTEYVLLLAEVLIVVLCAGMQSGRARRWTINGLWVLGLGLLCSSWIAAL
ncbi:MAG: hypothetical protein QOJ19_4176 [Acidimicrobiia bacterium]|nr:hypothetical protein [Acidimicrobiia bacterium]